jgi:hypothetical protein
MSRVAAGVLSTALLVSVAACGGSGGSGGSGGPKDNGERTKSAEQVSADAAAALDRAGSTHLLFKQGTDHGDLRIQKPDDATGTIALGGGTAELRSVQSQLFFKADAAFYKAQGGGTAASAAGTWLKLPGQLQDDEDFKTFSFNGILNQLRKPEDTTYTSAVVPVALDGTRPALKLTTTDGSEVYVSSVGEPLPLRVLEKDDSGITTVDFTEVGVHFTVTPPSSYVTEPKS